MFRLVGCGALLGSLATFSCGGRTSALDPDVYGSMSGAGGGSAGARAGTAGKPANGSGGTSSSVVGNGGAATAGSPSSSGLQPSLSATPCMLYCPGYSARCTERLNGQNCFTACQAELNGFGPTCQALGIEALRCLTPYFPGNFPSCDGAVGVALGVCGDIVQAFEACKKGGTAPTPTPAPTPVIDVSKCSSLGGGGDPTSCKASFGCANGVYTIACSLSPSAPSLATCTCYTPSGQQETPLRVMTMGKPCWEAFQACR